jgi:alcohol dehydrogenase class IV
MWEFTSPRTIVFGEEALEYLKELEGKRAFIVSGRSVSKLGITSKVADSLTEAGMEVRVFDQVEPEPSVDTVTKGAKSMLEFCPDWIVGLGGGSSMDAAKAMWILYERPDMEVAMINPLEKLGLRKRSRLLCIPTTSGSGSEATWATIITDPEGKVKMELPSKEAVPDIVILDPLLPSLMPPTLTAQTGMDVLTHSVEAYASQWRNDFSDAFAIKAIQLVFRYLPEAYVNGRSILAREKMHNASTMAGWAFSNSQVGIAHTMGHSLGALFRVPHGRCVGIFLPYSIEYSALKVKDRYVEIAEAIGVEYANDDEALEGLLEATKDLRKLIGEPDSIRYAGISENEFDAALDGLVDRAMTSAVTSVCPRIPSADEYRKLFICAFDGERVSF